MKPAPDSAAGGRQRLTATGELRTYRIPVNDRFEDSLTRALPAGYYLPAAEGGIAALLRLHGIRVERLEAPASDSVEVLGGLQLSWAPREFQGHHLLAVSGAWARAARALPAGTYFVPTAQPLGRLVFSLLEPEGFGLARWGLFDRLLGSEFGTASGQEFPVWRAMTAPHVPVQALP